MSVYGYSSERPGIVITHIVSCDPNTVKEMQEHSHRYDGGQVENVCSFVHFTVTERDEFFEKFDIVLVDSKNELNMLKKMITGT